MRGLLILCSMVLLMPLSFKAQFECGTPGAEYPCCCETCSCSLCGEILGCVLLEVSTGDTPGTFCTALELGDCDVTGTPCTTWWENNNEGVTGSDRGDGAPTDCIPSDGGLGFLIAGGLGLGVIGIRRRKEGLELEVD